jgi:hypothetical protein
VGRRDPPGAASAAERLAGQDEEVVQVFVPDPGVPVVVHGESAEGDGFGAARVDLGGQGCQPAGRFGAGPPGLEDRDRGVARDDVGEVVVERGA